MLLGLLYLTGMSIKCMELKSSIFIKDSEPLLQVVPYFSLSVGDNYKRVKSNIVVFGSKFSKSEEILKFTSSF